MKRLVIFLVFLFCSAASYAQVYGPPIGNNNRVTKVLGGYEFLGYLGVPTDTSGYGWAKDSGRIAVVNGYFFYNNGLGWTTPAAGSGVQYSDTAGMLGGYTRLLAFLDSVAALRAAVGSGGVKYTDTTGMLAGYARFIALFDTAAAIRGALPSVAGKVNYTDTAGMMAGYARFLALFDTAAAIRGALPSVAGKVNYTDTTGMLAGYARFIALFDTAAAIRGAISAAQVNSDWNAISGVAQILNKPSLAAVATSGAYSDLSGKPSIPVVSGTVASVPVFTTSTGLGASNIRDSTGVMHSYVDDTLTINGLLFVKIVPAAVSTDSVLVMGATKHTLRAVAPPSVTSPLVWNWPANTGSILQASGSQNGYISSGDWTNHQQAYNKYLVSGSYSAGTITVTTRDGSTWTVTGLNTGTVTSVATDGTLTGGPITSSGTLGVNTANTFSWSGAHTFTNSAGVHITQAAVGAGTPIAFQVTTGAHTLLTASTEVNSVLIDGSAMKKWGTGNISLQRENYVKPPTYTFAAPSVISNAYTWDIGGGPIAASNCSFGYSSAFNIESNSVTTSGGVITGAFGMTVNAPTGATNNYAGAMIMGSSTTTLGLLVGMNPFNDNNGGRTSLLNGMYLRIGTREYPSDANPTYEGIGFGYGAVGQYPPGVINFVTDNPNGSTNGRFAVMTRTTTTNSAPLERVSILASGNVGIGTTTPSTLLEVNGNGKFDGTLTLTSALTVANGGTGISSCNLGDMPYGSATNTISMMAGNTTTTKEFYTSTGTGSAANAPGLSTIAYTDLPTGASVTYSTTATGFSSTTVNVCGYVQISSKRYLVDVKVGGVSNAGTLTFTLPPGVNAAYSQTLWCFVYNNGVAGGSVLQTTAGSNTVSVYGTSSLATFTSSGGKQVEWGHGVLLETQ